MRGHLIDTLNALFLGLVLIGFPAVASTEIGGMRISSKSKAHQLVMGGLILGLAGDALAAIMLARAKPTRSRLIKWSAGYALLATLAYLAGSGRIQFDWLREWIVWVQTRV